MQKVQKVKNVKCQKITRAWIALFFKKVQKCQKSRFFRLFGDPQKLGYPQKMSFFGQKSQISCFGGSKNDPLFFTFWAVLAKMLKFVGQPLKDFGHLKKPFWRAQKMGQKMAIFGGTRFWTVFAKIANLAKFCTTGQFNFGPSKIAKSGQKWVIFGPKPQVATCAKVTKNGDFWP